MRDLAKALASVALVVLTGLVAPGGGGDAEQYTRTRLAPTDGAVQGVTITVGRDRAKETRHGREGRFAARAVPQR